MNTHIVAYWQDGELHKVIIQDCNSKEATLFVEELYELNGKGDFIAYVESFNIPIIAHVAI